MGQCKKFFSFLRLCCQTSLADVAHSSKKSDCQECIGTNAVLWELQHWEPLDQRYFGGSVPPVLAPRADLCHCSYGIAISFINLKSWEFGQQFQSLHIFISCVERLNAAVTEVDLIWHLITSTCFGCWLGTAIPISGERSSLVFCGFISALHNTSICRREQPLLSLDDLRNWDRGKPSLLSTAKQMGEWKGLEL